MVGGVSKDSLSTAITVIDRTLDEHRINFNAARVNVFTLGPLPEWSSDSCPPHSGRTPHPRARSRHWTPGGPTPSARRLWCAGSTAGGRPGRAWRNCAAHSGTAHDANPTATPRCRGTTRRPRTDWSAAARQRRRDADGTAAGAPAGGPTAATTGRRHDLQRSATSDHSRQSPAATSDTVHTAARCSRCHCRHSDADR